LVSLSAILAGCSENRAARVSPRCGADFATVRDLWNANDISSMVAYLDNARFLDDREAVTAGLTNLRRELGAISIQPDPMIDGKPEDPRAYAVAIQVAAMERGVANFAIAYGKDLTIVGFQVQGSAHPSAPR